METGIPVGREDFVQEQFQQPSYLSVRDCGSLLLKERDLAARKAAQDSHAVPPEIQDFDSLQALLDTWLPQSVVRRSSPPPNAWNYLRIYGIWTDAAFLLYLATASQTLVIAVPSCILAAVGIAWYFARCGRRMAERKWRDLLPLSGYLFATVLLGKAFTLLFIP
jgi:hypothetical protein